MGVMKYYLVITSVLFLSACVGNTRITSTESDKYVGFYSDRPNGAYNVIIKEQNGKLFGKDWRGKAEIILKADTDFRIKSIDISGRFNKFENGKYQVLLIKENGIEKRLTRLDISQTRYEEAIYDSIDELNKIDGNKTQAECPIDIKTGTVTEVSGDDKLTNELIEKHKNGSFGKQNSLLISKDGKLVVEEYSRGWSQEENHQMQSVSKSFTSLLLGDAIDRGFIESVDDPILNYLPKYKSILIGEKEKITIEDLLTMSAGLDWDEHNPSYKHPNNMRMREMNSTDSIEFTLSVPSRYVPGEVFTYSGGYVTVIGEIVKNATGATSLADFVGRSSLSNLCIKNAYWYKQMDGRQNSAGGLYLRPRDMAKVGQIILENGIWNDKQIIDEEWIEESTTEHISTKRNKWSGYGYYWWSRFYYVNGKKFRAIAALGYGGQRIIIIKQLNLVVVTTADNFDRSSSADNMMRKFIIPAFQ
jgi:CubicO group peptidase (beta-lactamase class C family)